MVPKIALSRLILPSVSRAKVSVASRGARVIRPITRNNCLPPILITIGLKMAILFYVSRS